MSVRISPIAIRWAAVISCFAIWIRPIQADELRGTKPLTTKGDLAALMVEGIDKYLMRALEQVNQSRKEEHPADGTKQKTVQAQRSRLRELLGITEQVSNPVKLEYVADNQPNSLVAETLAYKAYQVRWSVVPGIDAEGLLLEPKGDARTSVVAIPDADQTPESLLGMDGKVAITAPFAHRLASAGCRVIIPTLINRQCTWSGNPAIGRETNLSHREFLWRMSYEMGHHVLGYETQKVLAAVDWLGRKNDKLPVGVYGYGEGGLIALYAGAIDQRIKSTVVSGVNYNSRTSVWQEPIERSIWSSLPDFTDSQLRLLFDDDQRLILEQSFGPTVVGPPQRGNHREAAPGRLATSDLVKAEIDISKAANGPRVVKAPGWSSTDLSFQYGLVSAPDGIAGNEFTIMRFLGWVNDRSLAVAIQPPRDLRPSFDPAVREKRQFDQLVAHNQRLWRTSEDVRREFWNKADSSSSEKWEKSTEWYRYYFWEEIIGKLPKQTEPMNPRSRLLYDTPKWKGYEVTVDLYPDVFAYGILLLPKNLKPGEKRPVVVCQHGLEGRPQDVCNPDKRTPYYNSFGAQLADMGYIVYAPQNPYIGGEKFRVLLRKGHPLKLSLYSFIVRQHETTTDWLASLPFVDANRIAFYGLSYGGKTAMRIPAIVKRYCLSICSGDFNEWIGKNVSVDFRGSYMWTNEYDMYEFNLGQTFNYAEMAGLIAPRPFMVERGHDDGVGIDEMIAYEYAKVRYLYENKLKLPDRTAIEFFNGGHEIHLKGTAEFLKRHLGWPKD